MILHCHRADGRNHRRRDEEEITRNSSDDFGILVKKSQERLKGQTAQHGERPDGQGQIESVSQSGAGGLAVARAPGLRDADGDGHRKPEADDERHIQNIVGKSRCRQRQHPEPPDHERVGQRDTNLANLAGRERQREGGG